MTSNALCEQSFRFSKLQNVATLTNWDPRGRANSRRPQAGVARNDGTYAFGPEVGAGQTGGGATERFRMGYWGGGRGGGRGGNNKESNQPWYDVIRTDRSVQERPMWNLTCYGHVREGANDVVGDVSPEEVRYANMLSSEQGIGVQGLRDEFRTANRQRVDLFQGLSRGKQAPSQMGKPVQGALSCIRNLVWIDDAGTIDSGFRSSPATGRFGQQTHATGGFGQQAQTAGGFGQQAQATGGFGQQTQATGGFGQQTHATGGFGQQAQTTVGFGQQREPLQTDLPPLSDEEAAKWNGQAFDKGQIPSTPPPPQVC